MSDQVRQDFPRATHDQTTEPRLKTYNFGEHHIALKSDSERHIVTIIHGGERWQCLSYDPRQLNPDNFSAVGLSPEHRQFLQILAVNTCKTVEEAKQLSDFLPVDCDIARLRDGLASALYSTDLIISTRDPVAYHIDNIQNGLSEAKQGCDDIKRYLNENDLNESTTRVNLYIVGYHLDKAIDAADQIAAAVAPDI